MAEIITEVCRVLIMAIVFCIARYLIPWIQEKLGNERFERITMEVEKFVLAAEQMYPNESGAQRRAIVTEKVKELLIQKDISLTDEQIRDFIEAAVKGMNLAKE